MSCIRDLALAAAVGGGGGGDITVESLSVTENGTYTAPTGKAYSPVVANVPNTYRPGDEGKVVSSGALVAQTARASEITQNGTYDTTVNNSVTVNVSGGGSQFVQLSPLYANYATHDYLIVGKWYKGDSDPVIMDIYQVEANKRYFFMLGATVGNRYRMGFFTSDPTTFTADHAAEGDRVVSDVSSPTQYAVGSMIRLFAPPDDGYLVIMKSNQGQTDCISYAFEVNL